MAEYQEKFSKLLSSSSSSENRDSIETGGGDEEFYEEIEAPKFIDFTLPDHYRPDDRYWFCLRVGCDHKHAEEMDSEKIYKNFVLRVMAARSPNIKLRRALDRNASRTPIKCPLSAPPKSSKPRLSRMAIISSISEKTVDDKKRVVRSLLKPVSTPVTKTKPVAAKYLTTPRNKKGITNQNSFRSVQNPKPSNIEVPKRRIAGKALAFHSPDKIKKLNCNTSGRFIKSEIKLKLPKSKKLLGNDEIDSSKDNEGEYIKQPLMVKECRKKEYFVSSMVTKSMNNMDSAPLDGSECEGKANREDNIGNDEKENGGIEITSERCGEITDNLNKMVSSEGERTLQEIMDSDDKENDAVSDENRVHDRDPKKNGRKIFGMMDEKSSQTKKVTRAEDKNLKEGSMMKFKKPKSTNPKPFRLRTDERGILKEASLEKRTDQSAGKSENVNLSNVPGKMQRKEGNDIPKSKGVAACVTPKLNKHREAKPISNAIQRLEKFKKIRTPIQKHSSVRSQGIDDVRKKEVTSFLIPGQKLDVIREASPEVSELNMVKKPTPGRKPVTVG